MTNFDKILTKVGTGFLALACIIELIAMYNGIGIVTSNIPLWVYSGFASLAVGIGIKIYLLKKYW